MATVTLTFKGEITLPGPLREALGLAPGARLQACSQGPCGGHASTLAAGPAEDRGRSGVNKLGNPLTGRTPTLGEKQPILPIRAAMSPLG